MSEYEKAQIADERRQFRRKVRNAIEDAGDGDLTAADRKHLAHILVTNYNPLPATEADHFIEECPDLFERGWDEQTPPEKRPE